MYNYYQIESRVGVLSVGWILSVRCRAFFCLNVGCRMKNFGNVRCRNNPFHGMGPNSGKSSPTLLREVQSQQKLEKAIVTTRNVDFPSEENPRKYYWKLQSNFMKKILSLWISRGKPCGWHSFDFFMSTQSRSIGNGLLNFLCGKPSEGFLAEEWYKPLDSWSLSLKGNSTFLVVSAFQ